VDTYTDRRIALTRLREIETAVDTLQDDEYGDFREWFLAYDWAKWDRQIESDSKAGRLAFLIREAQDAKDQGTLTPL